MIEILLNSFGNALSFTFAEFARQPLVWIAVAFAIIATVKTLAQWYDVGHNRAAAACNGNPVVKRYRIPQSALASTHGTGAIPIIQTVLHFCFGQRTRQGIFARSIALFFCLDAIRVVFGPLLPTLFYQFAVRNAVLPLLFGVSLFSYACLLTVGFAVFSAVLVSLCLVFGMTSAYSGARLVGIGFLRLYRSCVYTFSAPGRIRPTFFTPIKVADRSPCFALIALLLGNRLVEHSSFTSNCLPGGWQPGGGKDRYSPRRARLPIGIVPQGGALCHT